MTKFQEALLALMVARQCLKELDFLGDTLGYVESAISNMASRMTHAEFNEVFSEWKRNQ